MSINFRISDYKLNKEMVKVVDNFFLYETKPHNLLLDLWHKYGACLNSFLNGTCLLKATEELNV